jgi:hypothetical protein
MRGPPRNGEGRLVSDPPTSAIPSPENIARAIGFYRSALIRVMEAIEDGDVNYAYAIAESASEPRVFEAVA